MFIFICELIGEKNLLFLFILWVDLSRDLSFGVLRPLKLKDFYMLSRELVWVVSDYFLKFGMMISCNLVVKTLPFMADNCLKMVTSLIVFLAW